jgi:glutathione S-transferase
MFAALNSIEQFVWDFAMTVHFYKHEEWAKLRRPSAQAMAEKRLDQLAERLGDHEWLDGRFTAGDLLMVSVLRILRETDLVDLRPALAAYVARAEARPAFQRALADQLAPFAENAPPAAS